MKRMTNNNTNESRKRFVTLEATEQRTVNGGGTSVGNPGKVSAFFSTNNRFASMTSRKALPEADVEWMY